MDMLNYVSSKREVLDSEIKRQGGKNMRFMYIGKPKSILAVNDTQGRKIRLNGFEQLERVKGKLKQRGKILLRLVKSGDLVRLSIRDIEVVR